MSNSVSESDPDSVDIANSENAEESFCEKLVSYIKKNLNKMSAFELTCGMFEHAKEHIVNTGLSKPESQHRDKGVARKRLIYAPQVAIFQIKKRLQNIHLSPDETQVLLSILKEIEDNNPRLIPKEFLQKYLLAVLKVCGNTN